MRSIHTLLIIAIMILTGCKPKSKTSFEIKTSDSTSGNQFNRSDNSGTSGWSKEYRDDVIKGCIGKASEKVSASAAFNYCNCITDKVQAKYPNEKEVNFDDPAIENMMAGCRENNTQPQSNKNESSAKTLNGIQLSANGVQVHNAFLALESGDLVPSGNTVSLGEKIVLTINSNGWKNINNKSYIGISQAITTNTGASVLETGDMFAKYDETGINAEYANLLRLKAYITETKQEIQYFNVAFRVWDKKGDGEITGSYKFYIK